MKTTLLKGSKKASLCLIIAGVLFTGYSQSQSTITFNVDGASAVVGNEVFGLLMETLGRQWGGQGSIYVGPTSTIPNTSGMRNDVIAGFKECGVGAVQWPGGCAANGYNWSSNKRSTTGVGVDRFIEFCKLTGAEAIISGKPTGNDAASNLAFASFIIDTLKYPLKWFKIGNEIWGGCGTNYTSGYTTGFTSNVDKLKALQSSPNGKDLKFIAAASSIEGGYTWIPTYYSAIGNIMGAIEIHDYIYRTTWSSSNPSTDNYWQIMNDIFVGDLHSHLYNDIIPPMNTADPTKKVKICLDEWGDWLQGDNWMQTVTVMDAISAGGHLNQFIQNADRVGVACLAQGVNVIHSIININTSGVMVKTPAFYVFKMYKPHHTNNAKFLPITTSSFEKANGTVPAVSAAATVDDGGFVNISFTNCDLSATRKVTVTLTNSHQTAYTVDSAHVVTGSTYTSTNPFGDAEQVNIKILDAASYSISGKVLAATLPSKSVVMFKLRPSSSVLQGSLLRSGKNGFSIKAGSNGTVHITSSSHLKTPLTVSLHSADGKVLIDKVSKTFIAGQNAISFGKNVGKGIYVVKVTGAGIDCSQAVVIVK